MTCSGIPCSPGIGLGTAAVIEEADLDYSHVVFSGKAQEKERLAKAIDAFCGDTEQMWQELRGTVGEKEAGILKGQMMMIRDPFMLSQMNEFIDGGQCAEAALDAVCNMYIEMFSSVDDELTNQRATDVRDIRTRAMRLLLGVREIRAGSVAKGTVLVARDFTPSMTVGINPGNVAAIVTETGGKTSHSAILARALEIPAVLGTPNLMSSVKSGDFLIVDGTDGTVVVSPDSRTIERYEKKRSVLKDALASLSVFTGKPTVSSDGHRFRLYGNIGKARDAAEVLRHDGEGVGLFRTEFLFMDRVKAPSEEEQFEAYREVAETMDGREVIIRTLDIGGDKDVPYLCTEKEENPFLGCRAIRYCLDREDIFSVQLRALLRASAFGNIRILLPLVSTVDELRRTKSLIARLRRELNEKNIPYAAELPVGVMIETPAAALIADLLAKEADFFSIGTNDLTQYTMAVDRGNAKVAGLYSTYHPAVIRSVRNIISAAKEAGIPVGMCGEAAADPLMIPLLISFGLDEFSVTPASVLSVRKTISLWSKEEADVLAGEVLHLSNIDGIEAYLRANAK